MTGPALKIGDQTITAAEVLPLLAQYRLLPQLVREILIDQAIAPIECAPEEEQAACQRVYEQQQLFSEADQQAWLQQQGMTAQQFQKTVTRNLKLERFKQAQWGNKLESYFLKRKGTLDRVIYSLLRVKDPGTAQEIYFRLADDQEAFDKMARQYSQGPEAQTGGLIGPVDLGTPHPTLARMLGVSQPGQLWPPTPVSEWFIIVRLEKFLPAQLDDAMRQQLLDELFNTWLKEQIQQINLPSNYAMATQEASVTP